MLDAKNRDLQLQPLKALMGFNIRKRPFQIRRLRVRGEGFEDAAAGGLLAQRLCQVGQGLWTPG
jgi:hypothetical protein